MATDTADTMNMTEDVTASPENDKSAARLRTSLSLFLAFAILVSLVCAGAILTLRYATLDPGRLTARFDADADVIAQNAYERLEAAFDIYGVTAGLTGAADSYYKQSLTLQRVRADVELSVLHAFDPKTPAPDIDGFHADIDAEIREAATSQDARLTEERSKALEYLSELCAEAYDCAITVPAAVQLSTLSERVRELTKPLAIGGFLLLAASCAFLFALHARQKLFALRYLIYGVVGAGLFILLCHF